MSLLAVRALTKAFGGVHAVADLTFTVEPRRVHSIIGPNGAGKTSLFNIVAGIYPPARGRVALRGDDVTGLSPHLLAARGLSRTFQTLQIFFRMTAIENVMVGRHLHERRSLLPHLFALPSVLRQNRTTRQKAEELLAFVGLAAYADQPAGTMPYGALKRLEIARALATEPKVLLLDEPAAGCNPVETAEIDAVIQKVAASGVAVVLVEHDMKLVMKISSRIHVLDQGRTLAEGTATEVRENPDVVKVYLGTREHAAR